MTINVRMWGKALRIIPKIEKEEFEKLDPVAKWLIATRGAVLFMTFFSCLIGGLFVILATGTVDALLWSLTALGLVLAHGASNLFNDYWDAKLGVDDGNYFRLQYGPHPLLSGLYSEKRLLAWAGATSALAFIIGAYLTYRSGWEVAVFAIAGGAILLLYAGKPLPLKHYGLGEPAVFIAWGPLMIGGTYFVLTRTLPVSVFIASLPYALGVTLVLFGKHIDKIEQDTAKHIGTVPVRLGEAGARKVSMALMVLMYAFTVALVLAGYFALPMLVTLLGLPGAAAFWKGYSKGRPEKPPPDYPYQIWPVWYVGISFVHNRRFGSLFLVGLIGDIVLRAFGVVATYRLLPLPI
jgi:1,4-dihydroxy-2-naphthoate octaprenyltransferase